MRLRAWWAVLGLAAACAGPASAAPVQYEGSIARDLPVTSTVPGIGYFLEQIDQVDFWSFTGTIGHPVDIQMTRRNGNLDPAFSLYFGRTSVDTSTIPPLSGWSTSDFGGLTFLASADDELPPALPGRNGDALLAGFVLPFTGVYTIVAGGSNSTDASSYPYELLVSGALPIAPSWMLVLLGIGVLAGMARVKTGPLHTRAA